MKEREKAQQGYLYDANYDKEIVEERTRCADLCYEFNLCRPSDTAKQQELLNRMLGSIKGNPVITAPFYCDYGFNITIGENFYTNHNVTILDGAKVTFGDNVFIGTGARILGNVHVGSGSIIGANAVVLHDVPERCSVAGVPAKILHENIDSIETIINIFIFFLFICFSYT